MIVPSIVYSGSPKYPIFWWILVNLPRKASRKYLYQIPGPPYLAPLDVKKHWLYFESLLNK